jgi:hypothetical protein
VASMKLTLEAKPVSVGGGGLPTPCIPNTTCPVR